MECLLPNLCMVTVPHIMVGLERMLEYRGVGLATFHCTFDLTGLVIFLEILSHDKTHVQFLVIFA